jgi:CheY-like chemotaxis protein
MSTVLVVDDQVSLLHTLEQSLLECGYDVKLATTGGRALQHIEQHAADVVILDLGLARRHDRDDPASQSGPQPPALRQRSRPGHAHVGLPGARRSPQAQGGQECRSLRSAAA